MNKIIVSLMCLVISLSIVSASYNFEYEKPDLDSLSYQLFEATKLLIWKYFVLGYKILSGARVYEYQLMLCETDLAKEKTLRRGSGGGCSVTQVVQESNKVCQEDIKDNWEGTDCVSPTWCDGADINQDGKVDLTDLGRFAGNQ